MRLAIWEPLIGVAGGHVLTLAKRLRDAGLRAGLSVDVLGSGALASGAVPGVVPHFRPDPSGPFLTRASRLRSVARLGARVARLTADLSRALERLPAREDRLVVMPTSYVDHWLAWGLLAPLRSLARTRVALVIHDALRYHPDGRAPLDLDLAPKRLAMTLLGPHVRRGRIALCPVNEGLARVWRDWTGLPVRALTVPVDLGGVAGRPVGTAPRLRFVYAGVARRDKGFTLLPALARAIAEGRIPRPAELVVQAREDAGFGGDPACAEALARLRDPALAAVTTIVDRALPDREYLELIAGADVALAAYDAAVYGPRTSSVLVEALALGRPAIATRGTWAGEVLARTGAGPVMERSDEASLVEAAALAARGLEGYARAAEAHRPSWTAERTPDAMLAMLLRATGYARGERAGPPGSSPLLRREGARTIFDLDHGARGFSR